MAEIKLKIECRSCDGSGAYRSSVDPNGVPCWVCEGKGWRYTSMDTPDPKWARQYRAEQRRFMRAAEKT